MVHELSTVIHKVKANLTRSQWPRDLTRRSAAARHIRLWVRIPLGAWTFFCSECCVLHGVRFYDELIIRLKGPYQMEYVVVCDLETS